MTQISYSTSAACADTVRALRATGKMKNVKLTATRRARVVGRAKTTRVRNICEAMGRGECTLDTLLRALMPSTYRVDRASQ